MKIHYSAVTEGILIVGFEGFPRDCRRHLASTSTSITLIDAGRIRLFVGDVISPQMFEKIVSEVKRCVRLLRAPIESVEI